MHENRETSLLTGHQRTSPAGEGESHTTGVNGNEESDGVVVPVNPSNKAQLQPSGAAERGEGRTPTKENIGQAHTPPAQDGQGVSQGLDGVRRAARERRQDRFTSLLHYLTVELLQASFYALKKNAAPGVDGIRWQEYEGGLEGRLRDLKDRIHRGAYRAQASRRIYIPKADGRQRPIGIAALEDKIVQQAVVTILNEIYEVDFRGFSYGFRPGRSPHQALDALSVGIQRKRVNWILDADIRGFFDHMSHEWDHAVRPTPGSRPAYPPADPEMAEGWSERRRRMVGNEGGHATRSGDFAATGQCLPALRVRSMAGSLAEESGEGRCHRHSLRPTIWWWGSSTGPKPNVSGRSSRSGWRSSGWNYTPTRRG